MDCFTKAQLDTIAAALDTYQFQTEEQLDSITWSLDRSYRMKAQTEEEANYMKLLRKNSDYQIALLEEVKKEINLLRYIIIEMKGDKE